MLHDLRFSFRLLRREGRHTVSVCLTMALGDRRDHAAVRGDLRCADEAAAVAECRPSRAAQRNARRQPAEVRCVQQCGVPCVAGQPAHRRRPRGVVPAIHDADRIRRSRTHSRRRRLGQPVSGAWREPVDRVALHRGRRDRRARPGRGSVGTLMAPAIRRGSRRARPHRAARRRGAYRGRRARGRGGVSRSHHPRLAPVPGAARSRQLAVDVQRDCGRAGRTRRHPRLPPRERRAAGMRRTRR